MIARHHDGIRIRAIGVAQDLVEGSRKEMAILQGALLAAQPARTHWSVRVAGLVVRIHVLNPHQGCRERRPLSRNCPRLATEASASKDQKEQHSGQGRGDGPFRAEERPRASPAELSMA